MQFVSELGLFALKTLLIAGSIIVVAGFLFQMSAGRSKSRAQIEVEKLNTRFKAFRMHLQSYLAGKKEFKSLEKAEKKSLKREDGAKPGRIFVLDFDGDIRATATGSLREEVTAILSVAKPDDEVVLRLESGGGLVTSYGLAAAQLERLKAEKIKLTICVDKVAASGGYMMACVADRILAAPFAVVGSIGVIAQVPNFNRLLKKADVDYREVTAGEFKRTVTVFGEITPAGMEKFKEQIESTHDLFKAYVIKHRPKLDLAKVATGEHWYGQPSLDLGLIDGIMTSDEYIFRLFDRADVFKVRFNQKKKWMDRFSDAASAAMYRALVKLWSDLDRTKLGL